MALGIAPLGIWILGADTISGGSGSTNGTASGVTFSEIETFYPGSATGVINVVVSGKTFSETETLYVGSASGVRNVTVSGVTFLENEHLYPGSASGNSGTSVFPQTRINISIGITL